jgi:hypothetical protein
MYSNSPLNTSYSQALAYNEEQPEANDNTTGTLSDPAKKQVLSKVINALRDGHSHEDRPGLTIYDVCDLTGYKYGFLRQALNEIVEEGNLGCLPGAGRRPSYYLLPVTLFDHVKSDINQELDNCTELDIEIDVTIPQQGNPYQLVLCDITKKKEAISVEIEHLTAKLEQLTNELNQCKLAECYLPVLQKEFAN